MDEHTIVLVAYTFFIWLVVLHTFEEIASGIFDMDIRGHKPGKKRYLLAASGISTLVDCNRLRETTSDEFFRLIRRALGDSTPAADEFDTLDLLIEKKLAENGNKLALLLGSWYLSKRDRSGTMFRSGQPNNKEK